MKPGRGLLSLAGVAGHPVGHSLSPAMMEAWLEASGLPGRYAAFEITPENLESALRALPALGVNGLNITVPHKQAALALCDAASPAARRAGAANLVRVVEGGRLYADNTDMEGVRAALKHGGDAGAGPAVVIGAGGAARAAAAVLSEHDREIRIVNRTRERAEALAADFGIAAIVHAAPCREVFADAALVINASALGMRGQPDLDADLGAARPDAVVFDMVYDPLETALLAAARSAGRRPVDGLVMLIGQARPSFEAFFGAPPPAGFSMHDHLRKIVEARA